jgi:hypothetical protein
MSVQCVGQPGRNDFAVPDCMIYCNLFNSTSKYFFVKTGKVDLLSYYEFVSLKQHFKDYQDCFIIS